MNKLDFCIWGCRDGFEVIHSENELWKNYLLSNSLVLDGKMQRLINSLDEFYVLNKNSSNQIISLVVRSTDKGLRPTYMVISLISNQDVTYDANILDVLHKIWDIYKRDNFIAGDTNNKGKHLTSNEFDIADIKNQINSIQVEGSNRFYREENCTIKIDDLSLLKNELGHFKGDNVYFINQDSQESALSKLPSNIKLLKEIVSRGGTIPEIEEFRALLKQKEKFERALPLFQRFQTNLTQQEIIDFSKWNDEIKIKNDVKKLSEFVSKSSLTEDEKAFIHHHITQNTSAFLALNVDEKEILKQKLTSSNDSQLQLANTLKEAIDKAKQMNWAENPEVWEDFLLKNPALDENLELRFKESLSNWRKKFNNKEESDCNKDLGELYKNVKVGESKKSLKKEDLLNYYQKFKSLSRRINSLNNNKTADSIKSSVAYTYLKDFTWEPRDLKKLLLKIVISILILGLFTIGYLWLKSYQADKELLANQDTDHDGVVDSIDEELKTVWIGHSTKFPLKNFVNSNGFVDTSKTKTLCDCWDFPDANVREILKCSDNLYWFVFEEKLYEYRMEDSENGRFYSSSNEIVPTSADNKIEKKHESLFPNYYKTEEDGQLLADPNKEYITITFENKRYRLYKGFTTDQGMEFGTKDREFIPKWRYVNKQWQKQPSKNGAWANAIKKDIVYLLSENATLITDNNCKTCNKKLENCECKSKTCDTCKNKLSECTCNGCKYWTDLKSKYDQNTSYLTNAIKDDIRKKKRDKKYECPDTEGNAARNILIGLAGN